MIHKTTRSILSVLLAALLLVTSTPLTPAFAGDGGAVPPQSESAEGRALKPAADGKYYISTAEQLKEFAELVNEDGKTTASAVLTADIDLNPNMEISEDGTVTNGDDLDQWTPIGTSIGNAYTGTFNGQNFKISGLYIKNTSSDTDDQGLFGYLSIDGDNTGTVQNLSVSGSVSGNNFVGGVVGDNRGNVINCAFSGSVSGSDHVGGVVGYNSGSVENCYNTGTVNGSIEAGGVVGHNSGNVENCYNIGEVSGNYVGGVVGYNNGSITNCYNTGNISGGISGGVVGYNIITTVTGCYFLTGTAEKGIGSDDSGDADPLTVEAFKNQKSFTDWDFGTADTNTWTIHPVLGRPALNENKEGGDGSPDSPYEISTATELENFRDLVNGKDGNPNAHAKLMNNIDLKDVCGPELDAETSWIPIGNSEENAYTGNFNGNGHTISGLYIVTTANNQGLFGRVNGGTVQNLTVFGSVNSSGDYVGGIVGNNSGTFENCAFTGSVSGDWYVGGVVGNNNGGTVTGCIFSGSGSVSVTGSYSVGGVVGKNSGSIGSVEKCHNTGSVSGSREDVGGVVGDNEGTVENCYNTGAVSGLDSGTGNRVGGVVGDNGGNVENCYNTGTVNVIGNSSAVGGVVGRNDSSVQNCYNTGTVTGSGGRVGGVVGWNSGNVTNCYNTDSITVTGSGGRVGGVVGYNSGSVENCYNTGTVSGSGGHVDGVVGDNKGTVKNCYYQIDKSAIVGSDGTTADDTTTVAKTAAEFHSGEVAWLLENGQTDGSSQVWGQSALGTEDSLPTLVALNPDAAKGVYQLTFDWHYEGAPEGTTTTTNVYTNGSVAIPEINHDRAGYHISGWKDASGAPVTTETAVTADTTYIAEWTANTYTITVTAGSGGTVSGSGEYSEGTEVTVTATPATGYHFVNWTENGTEVSTEATFTFNATVDRNLIAIFAKNEDPEPIPTPTPDPEPSGPSTGDSSGWDDIRDELENAAKGDQITIDMGDETKVPAEIFESLAGKDVDVTFDLGDIQWSVNGADIPTDTDFTDLDLGVNLDTHGIPVNVINTITGEVGTVQITLAHDGAFGFTMTLTAPLGTENAGYWANLYHFDEKAQALNFEAAAKIDKDGSVTIPFSHASQYAIVIDTHSHATVDVSDLFIDIAPDAWYKDAVQYAYDQGLMTGVSATEFDPEATTTRAMIVSILARLEGVTTAQAAGFADVDDEWYATAVNWAANVGVVNGYEDNTFRPNTAITREQLAAILMNYAAYKGYDVSARADLSHYSDADSISSWANDVLLWAVAEGLLTGVTDDTIAPQAHATRAQVAAILQRFLSE